MIESRKIRLNQRLGLMNGNFVDMMVWRKVIQEQGESIDLVNSMIYGMAH